MKKLIKLNILTLLLLCMQFVYCSALTPEDVVVSITIGNPIMNVNGVKAEIDEGRGTAAVYE